MGVSENRLNPIVPNGFADHYPYEKWLYIIGNINPTFSDKPKFKHALMLFLVSSAPKALQLAQRAMCATKSAF